MLPTVNPLAAAFSGTLLPEMVIVVNNQVRAISDVPKRQGTNFQASVDEVVKGEFEKIRPSKLLRRLHKKSPAKGRG